MKLSRRQMRQMISEELARVAEANTGITKGRHWGLSSMTGEKHWGPMASEEELVAAGQRSRDPGHAIHYDPVETGNEMPARESLVDAIGTYFRVSREEAESMFMRLEHEGQKRTMGLGTGRRGGG
jgi:hypothetical protein